MDPEGFKFSYARVAATHGVFSGDALARLEESGIEQIYVTNTLIQKHSPWVRVVDISPFIQALMKR